MSEEIHSNLQRATDFVTNGQFQEALDVSRIGLVANPSDPDLKLVEAISLSQLGVRSDASAAFAEAIRLAPSSAKARYNAAVHEVNSGNPELGRTLAEHTLQLDPGHSGARALYDSLIPANATQFNSNYARTAGSEFDQPNEGIAFVKNMGSGWTSLGWFISAVSFAYLVFSIMQQAPYFSEMMSAMQSGDQAKLQEIQVKGAQNTVLQIFGYLLIPINIVYMILDLIHRKGNMLWLIGHIPCSCCSCGWITMPIYMLFGRK